MSRQPILVMSDLHLGPAAPGGTEAAAAALLERYPERELICLGDLFDLSADHTEPNAADSVAAHFDRFSILTRALRRHLASGAAVTLVVGNHDAELAATGLRDAILDQLDLPRSAALAIAPWWIRRGGLHLEHGHVWDPDNAPIHPLAATLHDNEPLGIALTRRVLAPTGAYQFAHAHQTTPLKGLVRALRELQFRAPEVILRYFITGSRIFWQAASHGHSAAERVGERAIAAFALESAIAPDVVEQLTKLRPLPRHADPAAAFARLYFDRALATTLTTLATGAAIAEGGSAYLLVAAAGLAYLGCSGGGRAHRYSASLVRRVEASALGIRSVVDASAVVFGHTHVAQARSGYVNTGAFGFPSERGRPYLLIGDDECLERGWLSDDVELEELDHVVVAHGNAAVLTRAL